MKYIIIGGVAGGATAAARLRRNDEQAEITLFEKGPYISYANCGLPYYIGDTIDNREKLFVQTPESFAKRFNLLVHTNTEVIDIDPIKHTVTAVSAIGQPYTVPYDRLLLSPGASAITPSFPGASDLDGVFTLRDVQDTDRIKTYLQTHSVTHAVIVGGGFIGLEMAENLQNTGTKVAVVEMADQVMAPLDYSMASLVHQQLQEQGVALYLKQGVTNIERTEKGLSVQLSSGQVICTQLVLLSIGVRPNTSLAERAGLTISPARGIAVDEYLRTSDHDIYAVGDAMAYNHPITHKPYLSLLAGPANRQARIAADNMSLSTPTTYEGAIGTAIAKVYDITVACTGLSVKALRKEGVHCSSITIHPSAHAGYYPGALPLTIKLVFAPTDGTLYGAQAVGYAGVDKRIDQIAQIIKMKGKVSDLTRTEQAYAPPFSSAKDPIAMAGYVAQNVMSGKMKPLYWRTLQAANPKEVCIIDVRTPDEYALGAVQGAINIPLDDLRMRLEEIPHDRPIYLYCAVGLRGYLASTILRQRGYEEVYNLIGGYRLYKAATRTFLPPTLSTAQGIVPQNDTSPTTTATTNIISVDACGLSCPGPILKLKEAMAPLVGGTTLTIRATDPGFTRDAEAWCQSTGNTFIKATKEAQHYLVTLRKEEHKPCLSTGPIVQGNNKTFILFSDDLDRALATFVLANGAAATGTKVTIFFTFWGLNAIKKEQAPNVQKDVWGRMFAWMLPQNSRQLSLSKMNMGGLGSRMMRFVMRKKGIDSLETLRTQAIAQGVEFIACQMSMDVMGINREELLDEVQLGGVATYMQRAEQAGVNLFI